MDFGERLKTLRNNEQITQKQLAKHLGVGRPTIAGYETKGIQPSYETLNKIADYFKVSTDYLLGRTDEKDLNRNDFYKLNNTAEDGYPYNASKPSQSKDKDEFKDIDKLSNDSKKDLKTYIEFLKVRQKQLNRDNPSSPDKNNRDHDDFEI